MRRVKLTVAEAYDVYPKVSMAAQILIDRALDANEGGTMTIPFNDADAESIKRLLAGDLSPHLAPWNGIKRLACVAVIAGSTFLGLAGSTAAHPNECSAWASYIGKEGRVRDSLVMHGAGCDDGPTRSMHYDAAGAACAAIARVIVHENPDYWLRRPKTLAAEVRAELPGCRQFEDGTYTQ